MGVAQTRELIEVEDYLAGELVSETKREYLGGMVYAVAGATNAHNTIASNVLGALHAQLRGKRCRAFNSDTKIRVRLPSLTRFYYLDASVICRQNPLDDSFQDDPAVIVEVLSDSTRRIDETEKREAYRSISSLAVYILLEQESAAALVFRRVANGFVQENYTGPAETIPLPEIEAALSLADAYDGI